MRSAMMDLRKCICCVRYNCGVVALALLLVFFTFRCCPSIGFTMDSDIENVLS